jgi:hypothetical protein
MAQLEIDRHREVHPLWRGFAYACILFAVVSALLYARTAFLYPASYGGVASSSLGATLVRTTNDGHIDVVVHDLEPATPLARAGVRNGDRLRMDIPWNDFRTLATGEMFGFTRIAPGPSQHIAFVVPHFTGHSKDITNYRFLITLFDLGIGLLLFIRCRGDVGIEALGMAFVATAISIDFPTSPGWSIFWITAAYAGAALVPFLTLTFAISFYDRHSRAITRMERRVFGLAATALTICFVVAFFSNYLAYTAGFIRLNVFFLMVEEMFAYGATIYYFASGYRRARGDIRKRYGFLQIALLLTFCLTLVHAFSFLVLKEARTEADNPLYDVNVVLSLLGPLLFAYAALRHRVVDVGFVLNRTLVYGTVSLILLATFGLVEWAVDHVFKPASHNESAVVDAVIAVGVFLAFHRVRDAVESRLQALFFRRWHDNEKRLRRFVEEAGVITRADNLTTAFVDELARFTGGASVGLYLHDGKADYRTFSATPSGDSAVLDPHHPALAALRAHRRPVNLADTASSLGPGLALPMLQRSVLLGLILLGPKPDGDAYRPDEVEVLAYAAHHVGLDLHALKVEQLERERTQLIQAVSRLESEVARLRPNGGATVLGGGATS